MFCLAMHDENPMMHLGQVHSSWVRAQEKAKALSTHSRDLAAQVSLRSSACVPVSTPAAAATFAFCVWFCSVC